MQHQHMHKHSYLLILLEVVFIVLFAVFVRYSPNADAKYHPMKHSSTGNSSQAGHHEIEVSADAHHPSYGHFQDVQVMIFVGFGFLMTFLKKYGFSAVGINFMVAAVSVQWAILVMGFFHLHDGFILIDVNTLMSAEFMAATVLISFGALIGKTTPTQLILMVMIEMPIFMVNEVIGRKYFGAVDMGDSMFVHAFGAYFGLAVSFMLHRNDVFSDKEASSKISNLFSMIGTTFLWIYWPSFNSGGATGDDQHRAILNTYLALASSCAVAFALSSFLDPTRKFEMEHVQNSTLAGGVAIGTSADLMAQPYGALLIGAIAGIVSVLGYHYLSPIFARKLRMHDTCGVHNLHGMPALIAGIAGAIYCALANEDSYGLSLYLIFPLRAPENGTAKLVQIQHELPEVTPGVGRSASMQASFQLLALLVTLAMSIVGGIITGLILKLKMLNNLESDELFDDESFWITEEEEEEHNVVTSPIMINKVGP
ncbi:Ammonium transporter AmtB-like domain [Trinorchestia longiramus]|nr:Ammonium transporter AmtB-like domain [Trinorchestia longiramus]